jgi:glycine dehydrogenase
MAGMFAVSWTKDKIHCRKALYRFYFVQALEINLAYIKLTYFWHDCIKKLMLKVKHSWKKWVNFLLHRAMQKPFLSLWNHVLPDLESNYCHFAEAVGRKHFEVSEYVLESNYPMLLNRKSEFLTHEVFNKYHSETRFNALHQKTRTSYIDTSNDCIGSPR